MKKKKRLEQRLTIILDAGTHHKFKLHALKNNTTMTDILTEYIENTIEAKNDNVPLVPKQ